MFVFLAHDNPDIILSTECPKSNEVYKTVAWHDLRFRAKLTMLDYDHSGFGVEFNKPGIFACNGLKTLHKDEYAKNQGKKACPDLREAAVYSQKIADMFSSIIVKSYQSLSCPPTQRQHDVGMFEDHNFHRHEFDDKEYDKTTWDAAPRS